jgi:hypothetical protein
MNDINRSITGSKEPAEDRRLARLIASGQANIGHDSCPVKKTLLIGDPWIASVDTTERNGWDQTGCDDWLGILAVHHDSDTDGFFSGTLSTESPNLRSTIAAGVAAISTHVSIDGQRTPPVQPPATAAGESRHKPATASSTWKKR